MVRPHKAPNSSEKVSFIVHCERAQSGVSLRARMDTYRALLYVYHIKCWQSREMSVVWISEGANRTQCAMSNNVKCRMVLPAKSKFRLGLMIIVCSGTCEPAQCSASAPYCCSLVSISFEFLRNRATDSDTVNRNTRISWNCLCGCVLHCVYTPHYFEIKRSA